MRHNAVARILANDGAAYIERFTVIGLKDNNSVRSL